MQPTYLTFPNSQEASFIKTSFKIVPHQVFNTQKECHKIPTKKRRIQCQTPAEISRKVNTIYDLVRKTSPNKRIGSNVLDQDTGPQLLKKMHKYLEFEDDLNCEINCTNVYTFEKELFGSYSLPQSFDTAAEVLCSAKLITEKAKNIISGFADSYSNFDKRANFPTRKQIILLEKWVEFRKSQIEQEEFTESEKESRLTLLYFIAFLEISRQDSIICIERGKALTTVWSNYFHLQEKIHQTSQQEMSLLILKYEETIRAITTDFEKQISTKDDLINELQSEIAVANKNLENAKKTIAQLEEKVATKAREFTSLQQSSDKIKQVLAVKDAENKSLRLLGGGFTVVQNSQNEDTDSGININSFRDMMVRNKMANPVSLRKENENKILLTPNTTKRQSVLYDNLENMETKKKLTIRELMKKPNQLAEPIDNKFSSASVVLGKFCGVKSSFTPINSQQ